MNKKVLIVARKGILREDVHNIVIVLKNLDVEYFSTPHKEAVDAFKRCNPDTIIICDFSENWDSMGFQTYQKFSRDVGTLKTQIIRIGLEPVRRGMQGYIRFPDYPEGRFDINEFQKKIENFCEEIKCCLM